MGEAEEQDLSSAADVAVVIPMPRSGAEVTAPAVFEYMVGGRRYPMFVEPRCHTCTTKHRSRIETALLQGLTIAHIHRTLPEHIQGEVSKKSINTHWKAGHMPLAWMRATLEEHYKGQYEQEEGVRSIVTIEGFSEVVLARAFEGMVETGYIPTVGEGFAAGRMLEMLKRLKSYDDNIERERLMYAAFMDTLQEIMRPEQLWDFIHRLEAHPVVINHMKELTGAESQPLEILRAANDE
jgi:hypothetical protein